MSVPRPATFEPLASSDPVPGDSYETAALGRRLTDTAAEILSQAANLRKLASHSSEFWTGKAAKKFSSSASDLADRIEKAHQRYATTGDALTGWAPEIDRAQDAVYTAVAQVQAQQDVARANAPQPADPSTADKPPTAEQQAATRRRAGAYDDAQTAIRRATDAFHDAVARYNSKAGAAADSVNQASHHDGLHDSWWDRNFGWISTVMKIIAIVIIVLVIVAIVLACPAALAAIAGFLSVEASTLAAVATVAEWAAFGLTAASTAFDIAAAKTGKGSWTSVILDVASLCTFGFGKLAEAGIKGIAAGGEAVGKGVTAGRAGRAATRAEGVWGSLYSMGSKSPELRSLLSLSPKVAKALEAGDKAASAATEELEAALKGVKANGMFAALTQSTDIGKDVAKLSELAKKFPTVLRILGAHGAGVGLAGVDAAAQTGVFGVAAGYTVVSQAQELIDDAALDRRLQRIVHEFQQPVVPLR